MCFWHLKALKSILKTIYRQTGAIFSHKALTKRPKYAIGFLGGRPRKMHENHFFLDSTLFLQLSFAKKGTMHNLKTWLQKSAIPATPICRDLNIIYFHPYTLNKHAISNFVNTDLNIDFREFKLFQPFPLPFRQLDAWVFSSDRSS